MPAMSRAPLENKSLPATETENKAVDVTETPTPTRSRTITPTDTVKVRIAHFIDSYQPGQEVDLPADRAAQLVAGGYAKPL